MTFVTVTLVVYIYTTIIQVVQLLVYIHFNMSGACCSVTSIPSGIAFLRAQSTLLDFKNGLVSGTLSIYLPASDEDQNVYDFDNQVLSWFLHLSRLDQWFGATQTLVHCPKNMM